MAEQKTILCIEDEPQILASRKRLLEKSGYRVLGAATGAEGLEIFHTQRVDGVVLDCRLDDLTAGEVVSTMRRARPEIPIVVLVGVQDFSFSLSYSMANKVQAFVPKMDGTDALLETLNTLYSAARRRSAAA
jgi:DNA-binding response OmpR family regulator